jgi:LPXTG-motif cell wall-anchored protein
MMPFETPPPSVPATTPPGSHVVQHASEHAVKFAPPALPHTGADIIVWVLVGLALIAIGLVIYVVANRPNVRDV